MGVSRGGLLALHKLGFDNSIGVSWGGSAHGRRGQQGFAFPFPKAPGGGCWGAVLVEALPVLFCPWWS